MITLQNGAYGDEGGVLQSRPGDCHVLVGVAVCFSEKVSTQFKQNPFHRTRQSVAPVSSALRSALLM
eukprot:1156851-Pelagomonas_calceolata.AAC.8